MEEAILKRFQALDDSSEVWTEWKPAFGYISREAAHLRALGPGDTPQRNRPIGPRIPHLNAIVPIATLVAALTLIPSWHHRLAGHGSTEDPNFWVAIQSSIMLRLGLFTALLPVYNR